MGLLRKAGELFSGAGQKDVLNSAAGANAQKSGLDRAITVARDVVSGIHPSLAVLDDAVNLGQRTGNFVRGNGNPAENAIGAAQSLAAASAPALKAAGLVGSAGVVGTGAAFVGPTMVLAKPTTDLMHSGEFAKRKTTDAEEYRAAMGHNYAGVPPEPQLPDSPEQVRPFGSEATLHGKPVRWGGNNYGWQSPESFATLTPPSQ